jgi:hypothetical protein
MERTEECREKIKRELEFYRLTMPALKRHLDKVIADNERWRARCIELHMELDEGAIRIISEEDEDG